MQGKRFFLLDLCRQLWLDEFAPELERRVPVLFPFWKGWMLLVRQIVFEYPSASPSAQLRAGGKSRDAFDKLNISAYGSDAVQAPQFRKRPFDCAQGSEYEATLVTSDSDFRRLGHGFPTVWLKA